MALRHWRRRLGTSLDRITMRQRMRLLLRAGLVAAATMLLSGCTLSAAITAGIALGLGPFQRIVHIVVPTALRLAVPVLLTNGILAFHTSAPVSALMMKRDACPLEAP